MYLFPPPHHHLWVHTCIDIKMIDLTLSGCPSIVKGLCRMDTILVTHTYLRVPVHLQCGRGIHLAMWLSPPRHVPHTGSCAFLCSLSLTETSLLYPTRWNVNLKSDIVWCSNFRDVCKFVIAQIQNHSENFSH